jgi:hypothetical protein
MAKKRCNQCVAAMINGYTYLWVVQGNYGYGDGWEDLTAEEDKAEAGARLREYRENEPGTPHRIIRRRELRSPLDNTTVNH